MTTLDLNKLTTLLNYIAPNSTVHTIEALPLGFANRSLRLTVLQPDTTRAVYVVKLYSDDHENVFGQNAQTRAKIEYSLLSLVQFSMIPCPAPIFFDPQGTILGAPILVTKQLKGTQIMAHPANPLWAEQAPTAATLLARIHMLPCPVEIQTILQNATTQMTWFLRKEIIPDYMKAYPDGPSIWETINQALPQLQSSIPVIVHGDFWSGNILWDRSQVTGILDWENAACGEPGFDVANCRMEMIVDGMDAAADTFLKKYVSITNRAVANLGLCELVVAVQPMWQRAPFLEISPYQERFRQFVANAMDRL